MPYGSSSIVVPSGVRFERFTVRFSAGSGRGVIEDTGTRANTSTNMTLSLSLTKAVGAAAIPDASWDSVTVVTVARRSLVQKSMSATSTNVYLSSNKGSSQRMASRIESGTVTLALRLGSGWVRASFMSSILGASYGLFSGYGATTFPALTESITIENNATQAEYEVKRLKALVDGIIENINH